MSWRRQHSAAESATACTPRAPRVHPTPQAMPVVVHANVAATPPDPVQLAAELKSASDELAQARTLIERLQRQTAEAEAGALAYAAAAQKAQAYGDAAQAHAEAGLSAAVAAEHAAAATAREAEVRVAAGREGREGREAELAVARLQCEQLQGHMAELLEETREGEVMARRQVGGRAPAGIVDTSTAPLAGVASAAPSGTGPGAGAGAWAADDLVEDTRPGEPSLKAIEAELAAIEAAQAAPVVHYTPGGSLSLTWLQHGDIWLQAAPANSEASRRVRQFQQLASLQEEHQAMLQDVLAGLDAGGGSTQLHGGADAADAAEQSTRRDRGEERSRLLARSFLEFGVDELRHVFPTHTTAQLQQALADCAGDVNRAAASLLAD